MKRRNFLIQFVGAAAAVPVAAKLIGCGDSGDGGGDDADAAAATSFRVTGTGGHTHEIVINCSDLDSSTDITKSSMGGPAHTHSVPITAAQFAMIKAGTAVTVMTNDLGHPHTWIIDKKTNCA